MKITITSHGNSKRRMRDLEKKMLRHARYPAFYDDCPWLRDQPIEVRLAFWQVFQLGCCHGGGVAATILQVLAEELASKIEDRDDWRTPK